MEIKGTHLIFGRTTVCAAQCGGTSNVSNSSVSFSSDFVIICSAIIMDINNNKNTLKGTLLFYLHFMVI